MFNINLLAQESQLATETVWGGGRRRHHNHLGQKHHTVTDPGSPAAKPPGHLRGEASSSPEPPGPQAPCCPHLTPSPLLLGGPRARPASCPRSHRPAGSKAASALFPHPVPWADLVRSSPFLLAGAEGQACGSSATSPHLPPPCPLHSAGARPVPPRPASP